MLYRFEITQTLCDFYNSTFILRKTINALNKQLKVAQCDDLYYSI